MKLFYYQDDMANFGDDLNDWLWPKIIPNILDNDESHLLLGIGSILNHKLPFAKKYTVLGSGWGYGKAPNIDENWNIIFGWWNRARVLFVVCAIGVITVIKVNNY